MKTFLICITLLLITMAFFQDTNANPIRESKVIITDFPDKTTTESKIADDSAEGSKGVPALEVPDTPTTTDSKVTADSVEAKEWRKTENTIKFMCCNACDM
ncbi:uncharacterized protein LOC126836824 isoform X1 [Adelges cooleyi]|uniref:uncharacterized protein LOC126836824 isoform X1 n=1 Tax=Adelges cooleyi TaxID=133065 RepID=UPI0021801C4E|nr:uncharacterized protein LOC126836824 isoform X1 [Adelges cooleyi]